MKNLTRYFKEWNEWRKRNMNGRFYKFLVLIKLAKSPTFEQHRQFGRVRGGMELESNRK